MSMGNTSRPPMHDDTLEAVLADISRMAGDGTIHHIDASGHDVITRGFAKNPVPVHLEPLGGSDGGLPMILIKGRSRGHGRHADIEWIDPPDLSATDLWRAAAALADLARATTTTRASRMAAGLALKAESEMGGGLVLGRLRTPWSKASITSLKDGDRRRPSDRLLLDADRLPAAVLVKASFRTNISAGGGPPKIKTLLIAPMSINANMCRDDAVESMRILNEIENAIDREGSNRALGARAAA